jgi:hypothetical protein
MPANTGRQQPAALGINVARASSAASEQHVTSGLLRRGFNLLAPWRGI